MVCRTRLEARHAAGRDPRCGCRSKRQGMAGWRVGGFRLRGDCSVKNARGMIEAIIRVLQENPLLLLFVVAGIGYPLGRVRLGGANLGVAAVLFVGLAVGALSPELKLPEIVYTLGLVLFVYCIGLSSGAVFFGSLRRQGIRNNGLVLAGLLLAAGLAIAAHLLFDLKATLTAGMFAGSLTNTPALAGILEHLRAAADPEMAETILSEPVIAYSLTYPMGVMGMILAIFLTQRIWHVDYALEAQQARELGPLNDCLLYTSPSPRDS